MPLQVPKWIAILPTDSARVIQAFRTLLNRVNLTRAELGRRMGLGPSTVANWASGAKRPSLEGMKAVVAAIEEALSDLQQDVDRMRAILQALDETVSAHGRESGREELLAARGSLERALAALEEGS